MSASRMFQGLVLGWTALAVMVFAVLLLVTAPYGRHARRGWGAVVGDGWGWVLMEAPATLSLPLWFALKGRPAAPIDWVWLGMWQSHYLYRALIYPAVRRSARRPMPLSVVTMGALFNGVNGYLNGRHLFSAAEPYPATWLSDGRFALGAALFVAGLATHVWADVRLRALRARGQNSGYGIPEGGLFRWVSCPNYLGEIVEWCGWALATWSLAGLSFAVWTAANLAPRARAHHRWYRQQFANYPPERRALLPGLW